MVRSYLAAGLFDHPLPATPDPAPSTAAHKALARQIAERGSVLLKNAGVLPLTGAARKVAVIGQTASNTPTDGISAASVCAEGSPRSPFPAGNACPDPVAPLDGITAHAAQASAAVAYDNGADPAAAASVAAGADVAVVFGYVRQGEFADLTDLSLQGNGDALISAVAAANPNTVVVLETGSAVTMPWLDRVKGVVEAWYPGDQQGSALARLLYGDVNFTGKLPMTFPASLADVPTRTPAQYPGVFADGSTARPAGDTSIRHVSYSEGLAVGHKWYEANGLAPLFPFGYGLSYASFDYRDLTVAASRSGLTVRFRVTDTGRVAGTETAQAYLTLPAATGEPGRRLVSFGQVALRPGESRTVTFRVDARSADHPLSYRSTAAHAWTVAPGTYELAVGPSSQSLPLRRSFLG